MMYRFVLCGLLFFFLGSVSSLQAQQELPEVVREDGQKYYLHLVEQGQTLYAIARKYATSVKAIEAANPEVQNGGIKIGQTLRIPLEEVDKRELKRSDIQIAGDTVLHTVLRKETLYALSKKYNIEQEALLKINPLVEQQGLQEGMTVKIPIRKSEGTDSVHLEQAEEDSLLLHVIKPQETLYALSKQYGVSIDSIQLVNGGLPEGLKIGQTLRIPKANPRFVKEEAAPTEVLQDTQAIRWAMPAGENLRVGVFLPFKLTAHDTIDSVALVPGEPRLMPQSRIALDFYRGVRVALDSLEQLGVTAELHFFDSDRLRDSIDVLFAEELRSFHLFIGPMYRSNFELLAPYAKQHAIPVISPVPVSARILLDQPTVFKVYPSAPAHTIRTCRYASTQYADSNLFLIRSGRVKDEGVFQLSKKYLDRYWPEGSDTVPTIPLFSLSRSSIEQLLKDSTHYTLFVPSNNQAYVSELLTTLNDIYLGKRGIRFTVFGTNRWASYDNIETSYWMNLQVHFSGPQLISYSLPEVEQFIKLFRQKYSTDPNEFAFGGFDVTYYFLKAFYEGGSTFPYAQLEQETTLLSTRFNFIRVGAESGYENQGVFLYTLRDFEPVIVD